MPTAETAAQLARFDPRGAGTDAERRAARWLGSELERSGRHAVVEPFWCRPNLPLAHAWHVALALAGSLLSVSHAQLGGVLILVALLSTLSDALTGRSLGRMLTPERASQNVASTAAMAETRSRLIVTAGYDVPRRTLARRLALRIGGDRPNPTVGWLGWLTLMLIWLLVLAIIRIGHRHSTALGIAQLPPTVVLVIALALLLEAASSAYADPNHGDASGVAVALALVRALDAAPPANLVVELVLTGAGQSGGIGLRRHLRARRRSLKPTNAIVLGLDRCQAGTPRWWTSDGDLLPLHYFKRLRELSAAVAAAESHLHAAPYRGRDSAPSLPARLAGYPALAIGCRADHRDGPGLSGQWAMDAVVEFGLGLVDAIDAEVGRAVRHSAAATAA